MSVRWNIREGTGIEFGSAEILGKRFTVCRVDTRKERLRLFLHDAGGHSFRSFRAIDAALRSRREKLAFAMNAGMYLPSFEPVGLCVIDGHVVSPLQTKASAGNFGMKPNGVFLVSDRGARVVETGEYLAEGRPGGSGERVALATQSGPLLLCRGVIHPQFRRESPNLKMRNAVGVATPHTVVFAISEEPVTFFELSELFWGAIDRATPRGSNKPSNQSLGCPDALYLDGGISSLHAPRLGRSDLRAELGPIIGIALPVR